MVSKTSSKKTTSNEIKRALHFVSLLTKKSSKTANLEAEAKPNREADDSVEDMRGEEEVAAESKAEGGEPVAEPSPEESTEDTREEEKAVVESKAVEAEDTREEEKTVVESKAVEAEAVADPSPEENAKEKEAPKEEEEEEEEREKAPLEREEPAAEEPTAVEEIDQDSASVSSKMNAYADAVNMRTTLEGLGASGSTVTASAAASVASIATEPQSVVTEAIEEKRASTRTEVDAPTAKEATRELSENAAVKEDKAMPATFEAASTTTDGAEDKTVREGSGAGHHQPAGLNMCTLGGVQDCGAFATASSAACVGTIGDLFSSDDTVAKIELREKIATEHVIHLKEKNQILRAANNDLEAKLHTERKQLETKLSDFESLQGRIQDVAAVLNTEKKQLKTKLADYEDLQARNQDLETKNAKICAEKKQLETKLADLKRMIESIKVQDAEPVAAPSPEESTEEEKEEEPPTRKKAISEPEEAEPEPENPKPDEPEEPASQETTTEEENPSSPPTEENNTTEENKAVDEDAVLSKNATVEETKDSGHYWQKDCLAQSVDFNLCTIRDVQNSITELIGDPFPEKEAKC